MIKIQFIRHFSPCILRFHEVIKWNVFTTNSVAARPVSYTHLDVYKRQSHYSPKIKISLKVLNPRDQTQCNLNK